MRIQKYAVKFFVVFLALLAFIVGAVLYNNVSWNAELFGSQMTTYKTIMIVSAIVFVGLGMLTVAQIIKDKKQGVFDKATTLANYMMVDKITQPVKLFDLGYKMVLEASDGSIYYFAPDVCIMNRNNILNKYVGLPNVFTCNVLTPSATKYVPPHITYTGVTVGGITTGGTTYHEGYNEVIAWDKVGVSVTIGDGRKEAANRYILHALFAPELLKRIKNSPLAAYIDDNGIAAIGIRDKATAENWKNFIVAVIKDM